jgi:hypothetical protein
VIVQNPSQDGQHWNSTRTRGILCIAYVSTPHGAANGERLPVVIRPTQTADFSETEAGERGPRDDGNGSHTVLNLLFIFDVFDCSTVRERICAHRTFTFGSTDSPGFNNPSTLNS